MPYPPNFRRIAARTILPAIGASTCALGSHKCIVNIGSLIKNPEIITTDITFGIIIIFEYINMCGEFGNLYTIMNMVSIGREVTIV